MQQKTLQRVIDAEESIRRMMSQERQKASAWQDEVRCRCEQEVEHERQQLETSFARSLNKTKEAAQAKAAALITAAEQQAQSLRHVDPATIQSILLRHLPFLLPKPDTGDE